MTRRRGGRGGRPPQTTPQQYQPPQQTAPRDPATGRRSYTSAGNKDLEFDLDGVTWHPVGVPVLDMFEMSALGAIDAQSADDLDPGTLDMVASLWRRVMGAEYEAFKTHTTAHGTELSLLMTILTDLMAGAGKGEAQPGLRSVDGPSTNVRQLSGHSPRSRPWQAPLRIEDREEVSPFSPSEIAIIARRKADERDELRRMGFTDADLNPGYGVG